MIEVQCTSCHTRYRIDERVLPEGLPTFKCSRCGHVFSFEPRKSRSNGHPDRPPGPETRAETANNTPADGAVMHQGEIPPDAADAMAAAAQPSSSEEITEASGAAIPSNAMLASTQPEAVKEDEAGSRYRADSQESLETQPQKYPDPTEAVDAHASKFSPQMRVKKAGKLYSQVLTGDESDAASGENLSFDFADEEPAPDQAKLSRRSRASAPSKQPDRESPRWQVGEEDLAPELAAPEEDRRLGKRGIGRRSGARLRTEQPDPQFAGGGYNVDEEAPLYHRTMTHSARFFVLLVFLVGVGYGIMTLLIHSAPGRASAVLSSLPLIGDRFVEPATPAKLVALRDVNAVYQEGKQGSKALLITGTAQNVSTESLRLVQLTAAIHDTRGHSLASQAVYCGNNVSRGMVGQMTPREIEFYQKLEPAKSFALEPSASCRFVAVFINPPGTARAYDVVVSQAVAGTAQAVDESAP